MNTIITHQELTSDAVIDRVLDRQVSEHGEQWTGTPDTLWQEPEPHQRRPPMHALLSNLAQDLITEGKAVGWGAGVQEYFSSNCELHVFKSADNPAFVNSVISEDRKMVVYLVNPPVDREDFDGYAVVELPSKEPGLLRDALRATVTDLAKILTSLIT